MRELSKPIETTDDDNATEMVRIWLAHQDLHVSLFLGMWEDAEESEVDERDAWGRLLADTVQHIAHGLAQSHGWDKEQTTAQITRSFLSNVDLPEGDITGSYVD